MYYKFKYPMHNCISPLNSTNHSKSSPLSDKFSKVQSRLSRPQVQPDTLDDPDGGAPRLVGGQVHEVPAGVPARHEELEGLLPAQSVPPKVKSDQSR